MNNKQAISNYKSLTWNCFLMGLIILMSLSVFALTTNNTTLSGGIYNGGFEYGTGSKTSTGIIGDTNYGWTQAGSGGTTFTSDYNSTIKYSGNQSIRSQVELNTGAIFILTANKLYSANPIGNLNNMINCYNVKPSTKYHSGFWAYIESMDTNVKLSIRNIEYSATGVRTATPSGTNYTTVGSWIYISTSFTTQSTDKCVFVEPDISLISATTGTDLKTVVYFDDVRLEEVDSVNLSGQSQGRPSIVVTGVSDFNAIDQADTNNSGGSGFGTSAVLNRGQCFTPTQSNMTGLVIQRSGNLGTYTGDVVISLRDENTLKADTPLETVLTSVTIPNATWLGYTTATDIRINLPYTLTVNGTKKYCWDASSTVLNDTNNSGLRLDTSVGYSGGKANYKDATQWIADATKDFYFKTTFEKQSSAFDLNVCSSGDTVCESKTYDYNFLANGLTYTITPANAPLFYSGDNNVYYMQHSDSLFENKTPSMMGNLLFTFDKPTTTSSIVRNAVETDVTLTCTPGTLEPCYTTAYSYNGTNYFTYTNPLQLNNESHELYYYSNDTRESYENPTHITISAPSIPQITSNSCSLVLGGMNTIIGGLVAAIVIILLAVALGAIFLVTRPSGSGYEVKDNSSIIKVGAIVASLVTLGLAIAIVLVMIINLCH